MKIAVINFARLGSKRLPNKLLKTVGGVTLLESGMKLLSQLQTPLVSDIYDTDKTDGHLIESIVICPGSDRAIVKAAANHNVICLQMTDEASQRELFNDLIKPFIPQLQQYDYVWDANFFCHPFLTIQTCKALLNYITTHYQGCSLTSPSPDDGPIVFSIPERNPLHTSDGIQFWGCGQLADTKNNPLYYRPSHIGYIYPTRYLSMGEREIAYMIRPVATPISQMELTDIDTVSDLETANLIADGYEFRRLSLLNPADTILDAIACGTGPSFFEWIKSPIPRGMTTPLLEAPLSHPCTGPRLYGCGVVPNYINGLTAYGYGDVTHVNNIPDPNSHFHPLVKNYSGTRNLHDKRTDSPNQTPALLPFTSLDLPHGESSGGMALSMACLHHNVVGIIGFDGYRAGFADDGIHGHFVTEFRKLINTWQSRGRRIISLMPDSVFNPITEPACLFLSRKMEHASVQSQDGQ